MAQDSTLSAEQRSVLLGTLLGDACLSYQGGATQPILSLGHSAKQREYLQWKVDFLGPLFKRPLKDVKIGKYDVVQIWSRTDKALAEWYELFYPNGKKVLTRTMLDRIDDLALAVWFMDDGTANSRSLELVAGGLTELEYDLLRDWLLNSQDYDVSVYRDTRPKKNCRRFYFMKESALRFVQRIERYIHPTMRYKIGRVLCS